MSEDTDTSYLSHVRALIQEQGRDEARRLLTRDQHLVDIAAEMMADETQRIGITYTGFCLTSLPHKRLPDDQPWEKKGHRVTLLVEPGRMQTGDHTKLFGVPYGARARMILLYLQTQAAKNKSPEVELGRSMRDWMERMGIAYGGETARALRDQATRLSACSLKFFWETEKTRGFQRSAIIKRGMSFLIPRDDRQGLLWEDHVVLDGDFFQALREHPVLLREAAIRQLKNRSLSIDLYVWLAYRLHTLKTDTPISWAALQAQFGAGYRATGAFRRDFKASLTAALAAYPEAKVNYDDEGFVLRPSPPPVLTLAQA
jgi:hypothetical protein